MNNLIPHQALFTSKESAGDLVTLSQASYMSHEERLIKWFNKPELLLTVLEKDEQSAQEHYAQCKTKADEEIRVEGAAVAQLQVYKEKVKLTKEKHGFMLQVQKEQQDLKSYPYNMDHFLKCILCRVENTVLLYNCILSGQFF